MAQEQQPVFIQDILEPIVAKVSTKLLPSLQAIDPTITAVHYDYGHPLEIIETLSQKTAAGGDFVYTKYPLIALFLDAGLQRGRKIGVYGKFRLHMAIIKGTNPNYKAKQRDDNNFKPFLVPIYLELLSQLKASKAFSILDESLIIHDPIYRYYWGRKGLYGNEGNIFNDHVDCIELNNLELELNINYCPKPAI